MSEQPVHDCGHACCDEPNNPHHDHFLPADQCTRCVAHTTTLQEFRRQLADLRSQVAEATEGEGTT